MAADPVPPPSWGPADALGSSAPVLPVLDRAPGMVGALGPGTLDLSLPSDGVLMAAGKPNPERERDRVLSGVPERIAALGQRFSPAGVAMDESYRHSEAAQQQLASTFVNDGVPVYDRATHFAAFPKAYRDAGTYLQAIGKRLTVVAEELTATQTSAKATVTSLLGELAARRTAWAGEVEAARGPSGLIPFAAAAGLVARRDAIAAGMQREVDAAGARVTTAIMGYEGHVASLSTLLAEAGYAERTFFTSPFANLAVRGPEQLRTPIQAGGPLVETMSIDDGLRLEGGYTPIPGGPEILINVPGSTGSTATDQGQLGNGLPLAGLGTTYNSGADSPRVAGPAAESDLPTIIGTLREAVKGKGNFGLGSGTRSVSDEAGRAWVGPDATVASDGKTLVSADGLRQYRPPTYKPFLGREQANFEERLVSSGRWQSNGHLDIVD